MEPARRQENEKKNCLWECFHPLLHSRYCTFKRYHFHSLYLFPGLVHVLRIFEREDSFGLCTVQRSIPYRTYTVFPYGQERNERIDTVPFKIRQLICLHLDGSIPKGRLFLSDFDQRLTGWASFSRPFQIGTEIVSDNINGTPE
jgi:hypothetical protein